MNKDKKLKVKPQTGQKTAKLQAAIGQSIILPNKKHIIRESFDRSKLASTTKDERSHGQPIERHITQRNTNKAHTRYIISLKITSEKVRTSSS